MSLHRSLFTWFTLLVFLVLLVLRLDNRTQWNWFVVFIPIWIFNSILFIYSTFDVVSLCKNRTIYRNLDVCLNTYVVAAVILKMAFEIMLCLKLESPSMNLPTVYVLSPLWVILPVMSLDIFLTLINKELQNIQLSSVQLHNKFEANITVIKSNYYPVESVRIKKGLAFSRFKPDNIMHVIHDDLLPLFLTLQEICLDDMIFCDKNYQLLLHDNYEKGPYFNLYKTLTDFEPVILPLTSKALHFDELHMGLVRDSVFYQYGFNEVQGPVENFKINGKVVSQFAEFITRKLNVKTDVYNNADIVLISRKSNRKILNEENLIRMLESVCKKIKSYHTCKIVTLDLFQNGTNAVIEAMRQASMLVGMHGAEMIFSIFLRQNSTVVELFPFGIQPDAVSFVKALSKFERIHFHYVSWENSFKNYSVFHPDADSFHGGINLLPKSIQDEIKSIEKVPAVKCCNDPTYLYHMYQDTWIDSSFEEFLTSELVKLKNLTWLGVCDKWFFPSIVRNALCWYNQASSCLNVTWVKPFNMENETLMYDVLILGQQNFRINIVTGNTSLVLGTFRGDQNYKFKVWISAIIKRTNTRSKDVYIECM